MIPSPPPPAVVSPAPRAAPWIASPRPWNAGPWLAQHRAFVERAQRGAVDVLFLGDSITEYFATRAPDVWSALVAPYGSVANFGIAGDRTQFLLWRVEHGEAAPSGARVVVLLIGTNNLAAASAESVARGVAADLDAIRMRLPRAVIVLNALLPRETPDDPQLRAKLADVNARIRLLADGEHVRWLDAGAGFLDGDGHVPEALMPDGLHPSPQGYEVWATALRPLLDSLLSR